MYIHMISQCRWTYKIEKFADTIIVREEADIDKIAEKLAEKLEAIPA